MDNIDIVAIVDNIGNVVTIGNADIVGDVDIVNNIRLLAMLVLSKCASIFIFTLDSNIKQSEALSAAISKTSLS